MVLGRGPFPYERGTPVTSRGGVSFLDPRDPLLHSERTQGFAADPDNWKGEVFAYVGLPQNLKDLPDDPVIDRCDNPREALFLDELWSWTKINAVQGYLAHKKPPPPKTLQYACASGPTVFLWGGGAVL